jgi:transcriptional regulator with XRE-family HTH domain
MTLDHMSRAGLVWMVDVAKLERARILRGWTQRRLAIESHVDRGTLSSLAFGRRRPTLGTIQAVCRVLDLSLRDVILFPDEQDEDPV